MTIKRNELKKVYVKTHYVVFMTGNPDYKRCNVKFGDLTEEEYICISRIVDEDMRIKATYAYTEEVFGAPTHLDLPI